MRATRLFSLFLPIILLLSAVSPPTQAQSTISSFTIDGGGGSSQGGTSEVSGTIG